MRRAADADEPGARGVVYVMRIECRETDARASTSQRAEFAILHALRSPSTREQLYGDPGGRRFKSGRPDQDELKPSNALAMEGFFLVYPHVRRSYVFVVMGTLLAFWR